MAAPLDDLTLHAWLDGELDATRRAEVDTWLAANPDDAARVRRWAADRDLLRTQLAGVLDEPVPLALQRVVWRHRAGRVGWQRWAAAVAVFALGGVAGAGLVWRTQVQVQMQAQAQAQAQDSTASARGVVSDEPAWVARAAVAHAVYVPEVRHPVEVKATEEQHLAGWLTKRLEVPVKVFDLRAQGFELVGGRLLPDGAGPSAQLMYQAIAAPVAAAVNLPPMANTVNPPPMATGASAAAAPVRVTVYLRKPERDTPAAFRYERQGGLGLFYWIEGATAQGGPCGYALVGALPRDRLLALAEAIYRQGDDPQR